MLPLFSLCLSILVFSNRVQALPRLDSSSQFGSLRDYALLQREESSDEFDPEDLSFIKTMAAIGDSYSAGIGSGERLSGDFLTWFNPWACSRYDRSYPMMVNNDARLGDPSKREFQFLSCSGATVEDIMEEQIPKLLGFQEVIMLSAGGNDAELTRTLNQCVFQWATLQKLQVEFAKVVTVTDKNYEWAKGFDFDSLAYGCEKQIGRSMEIINSPEFARSLDSLITSTKLRLTADGMIYYTGYAQFWDEGLSHECDSVTWSSWTHKLADMFQEEIKLTKHNRKAMNDLVKAMNIKLAEAVDRAGPNVKFVDYDYYFQFLNGRFCAPGVDESSAQSNTRDGLLFYEANTWAPGGQSPWKRSNEDPWYNTFHGNLDAFAAITMAIDDSRLIHEDKVVGTKVSETNSTSIDGEKSILGLHVPSWLPDGYARVFHPTLLGHSVIANLVVHHMVDRNSQIHGGEAIPELVQPTICPLHPRGPPPTPEPAPEPTPGPAPPPPSPPANLPPSSSVCMIFSDCSSWSCNPEDVMTCTNNGGVGTGSCICRPYGSLSLNSTGISMNTTAYSELRFRHGFGRHSRNLNGER